MTHVLRVPDKELVATAGIDALAFIRVCQFGIQLFVPISLVVVIVFIPVHVSGDDLARQKNEFIAQGGSTESLRSGLNSRIMRTTAANLPEGANVLWLYVFTFWGIVLYSTWLLRRHTRTFALLRQLYLTTAGDTNLWRAVHMPTTILQQMLVQGREMEAEMNVGEMRALVAEGTGAEGVIPGDEDGTHPGDISGDVEAGTGTGAGEGSVRGGVRPLRSGTPRAGAPAGKVRAATASGTATRMPTPYSAAAAIAPPRDASPPRGAVWEPSRRWRCSRRPCFSWRRRTGTRGARRRRSSRASRVGFPKSPASPKPPSPARETPLPPRRSGWGCTRSSPRAITTARGFPRWRRMTATAAGRRIRG